MKLNPATWRRWLSIWLIAAAAYVVLGKICINLGTLVGTASPFWLPAGLVTGLSLRRGYRVLPGIFLGQMLVGLFFSPGPLWPYLLMATGNVVAGAVVVCLAPRLMIGRDLFASVHNFFAFFTAALAGCSLNAFLGAGALWLAGAVPLAAFASVMANWTIGDLGGTLIVAPLVLSLKHIDDRREWQGPRLIEFLLLIVTSCGFTYAIFSGLTSLPAAPLAFVLLPFLLWTAFRFGPMSSALNNALLMAIVIWGTTHGRGPFVATSATESLVLIQLFTSVMIVTALLALIVNRDRLRMTEELRHEAGRLEAKVAQRTAELQLAMTAAEAASRAKSEFLASMSHELRTPLNAILGFSQLFELDGQLSGEGREHAGEIVRAGQHLLSLVNDLIDLARIENGRMELSVAPVHIGPVVKQSIEMVAALARKHDITVIEQFGPVFDAAMLTDRDRLRQVLINLLSNAIKYNRPQGTVTVACAPNQDRLRISVTDTGPGIPADRRERIFNPFDRLGREGGNVEGTGIGLVISKRIIEALGGQIGFDSTMGKGTTFWIEFPASTLPTAPPPLPPTATTITPSAQQSATEAPRVLLAEDNLVNQKVAVALLKKLGFGVDVVDNGTKAVTAAADGTYALILMDCQMPEMDGYQAAAAIRQAERASGRRVPIAAITANAMEGDRERCLAAGMDDYIAKPVNIDHLRAVLGTWVKP